MKKIIAAGALAIALIGAGAASAAGITVHLGGGHHHGWHHHHMHCTWRHHHRHCW